MLEQIFSCKTAAWAESMLEHERSVGGHEELLWTDHPLPFPLCCLEKGWSEVELGRGKAVV